MSAALTVEQFDLLCSTIAAIAASLQDDISAELSEADAELQAKLHRWTVMLSTLGALADAGTRAQVRGDACDWGVGLAFRR